MIRNKIFNAILENQTGQLKMIKKDIRPLVVLVFFMAVTVSAGAWAADEKRHGDEGFAACELLVRFHEQVVSADKIQARERVGARVIRTVPALNVEYWRLPAGMTPADAMEMLSGVRAVDHAEPNYFYSPGQVPDDRDFGRLWYLENTGQRVHDIAGTPGADISATAAWELETGSPEVVIAVIDSGVAMDHPDLKNNIWSNREEIPENGIDDDENGYVDDVQGWDFVNYDNNPSDYSKDLYGDGHGTHVAGIIAAEGNNGIGAAGVMWQARIMPVQIFDLFENSPFNATTLVVLEAVLYAVENGADILNCSFGGPSYSRFLYEAYEMAGAAGVLVVAAAGNDGLDNDRVPVYPAGYKLDNIISVAATNENDDLAGYSNYGSMSVDLAAPGGSGVVSNIYSTTPPERTVIFTDDFESPENPWITDGKYDPWVTVYDKTFNSTVAVDSVGNYHNNAFSYIRTAKPVPAEGFRGLNLRFNVWYALEQGYDFLDIGFAGSPDGNYETISTLTGFSQGIEHLVIWSNDAEFDDFYLRFALRADNNVFFDGVYLDDIFLSGIKWRFSGDEYGFKSGTSMATPVVAGVAGLVWSAAPALNYAQVRQVMINTVDLLPRLAGKVAAGGRVNARAAVLAAMEGTIPSGPSSDLAPDPLPDVAPETEASGSGGDSGCFIASL